jgi:hypothetical protein
VTSGADPQRERAAKNQHAPWLRVGLVCALTFIAGCPDPLGNDPNLPDDEADGAGSNPRGVVCPPALPESCPQTPSYSMDIEPILQRTCLSCHAPGGVAADRDLTTYKNFRRLETTNFVQVNACLMPPADAGPDAALSLDERTELLQWFVCGSPNN